MPQLLDVLPWTLWIGRTSEVSVELLAIVSPIQIKKKNKINFRTYLELIYLELIYLEFNNPLWNDELIDHNRS